MPRALSRWTEPSLQNAIDRCRVRSTQGIHCTIAFLGGQPQTDEQASQAVKSYLDTIVALSEQEFDRSITVKPTMLGAVLDKARCTEHILTIFREAVARGVGFEIATEAKSLVEYTAKAAVTCAKAAKEGQHLTLALQAYLDRTSEDLKVALDNGIRPRLVKGAYLGDTSEFTEIQERFKRLAEGVLENKHFLAVGTHDPELMEWLMERVGSKKTLVEFGFLKGLADSTKLDLAGQGWDVLEYIPFGENVEAYESRRWKFLRELEHLGKAPVR
jgi:proline dehydrogenase